MTFEYWSEGVSFILIFIVMLAIPCVSVAWIGYRMINKLGRYPSRTSAIQMDIFFKLVIIEVVSFGILLGFYKIFQTD